LSPAEADAEPGSSLASTLGKQLGLNLTQGQAKLEGIVLDHPEKIPTRN